jgi:amino acid transporter
METGSHAAAASAAPEQPHLGPRRLTTIHAIGQALAIGPIFSLGFVSGLVANVAGYSTPLSVVLASVGCMGLAYVIAVYARRFAGAGAIYEYLARAVHNSFGIFSAGVYLLGAMFLGAGGIYVGLGILIQSFFQTHLHTSIPWWVGGAFVLALAFALNHFGVRIAIRAVLALAIISAIPFVILAVAIMAKGGAGGNTLAVFTPSPTSWNTVFNGILFAVLLYVGFEAAASIAEETRNPRKSIPIAVVGAVFMVALLYVLVTYAATIGFGKAALAKDAWFSAASPMGLLAHRYVGKWLSVLIDLVVIFDATSLAIAIMVTASRIIFAFGRDGLLPALAARTSRYGTPLTGNVAITLWSIALLIWGGLSDYGRYVKLPNPLEFFDITSSAGSYLVELVYVFLALFAFKLLWQSRHSERGLWWKVIAVALGLATPILAFKGSLSPFPTYPNDIGVFIAIGGVVLSALWYGVLHFARPAQVKSAAAYAVESPGAAPAERHRADEPGAGAPRPLAHS